MDFTYWLLSVAVAGIGRMPPKRSQVNEDTFSKEMRREKAWHPYVICLVCE